MYRHRVHLIITADGLERPTSFRMDVFTAERNFERAYEVANQSATDQLGQVEIISSSAEVSEV